MTPLVATAPGKLILTGEYAVLDGAPAIVIAVNRRVIARLGNDATDPRAFEVPAMGVWLGHRLRGDDGGETAGASIPRGDNGGEAAGVAIPRRDGGGPNGGAAIPRGDHAESGDHGHPDRGSRPRPVTPAEAGVQAGRSEFLLAVVDQLVARFGERDPSVLAARRVVVDSASFYADRQKLGLGSSAAVTVAATARALAERGLVLDRDEVLAVASAAHATAQGARGARGSGADVAAAVHGGVLTFTLTTLTPRRWPATLTLLPFFTGVSADTATLVAHVAAARTARPADVGAALAAITTASSAADRALAAHRTPALAGPALLAALRLAASATDRLALAAGVPLVPACVTTARTHLARLGGTAKTTGAGGGDVAIAVIPATADATEAHRILIECGCQPLALTVDETGVDLRPDAQ